jgi:hypothetical protein
MGGDWNHVTDPLDVQGAANLASRAVGGPEFETLLTQAGLVDAWRLKHPGERGCTFVATNGESSARLDRWYVPAALATWVASCNHLHGWPGDHLAVCLVLRPPGALPSGPGRFRLPLQLLNSADYCAAVNARAEEFLAQHPVHAGYSAVQRWLELKDALTVLGMSQTAGWRRTTSETRRQLRRAAGLAYALWLAHPDVQAHAVAYRQAAQQLRE